MRQISPKPAKRRSRVCYHWLSGREIIQTPWSTCITSWSALPSVCHPQHDLNLINIKLGHVGFARGGTYLNEHARGPKGARVKPGTCSVWRQGGELVPGSDRLRKAGSGFWVLFHDPKLSHWRFLRNWYSEVCLGTHSKGICSLLLLYPTCTPCHRRGWITYSRLYERT